LQTQGALLSGARACFGWRVFIDWSVTAARQRILGKGSDQLEDVERYSEGFYDAEDV